MAQVGLNGIVSYTEYHSKVVVYIAFKFCIFYLWPHLGKTAENMRGPILELSSVVQTTLNRISFRNHSLCESQVLHVVLFQDVLSEFLVDNIGIFM